MERGVNCSLRAPRWWVDLLVRGWERVREGERDRMDGVWGRDWGERYDVGFFDELLGESSAVGGRG